ncbi:MAG TPA: hypothetical protein VK550_12265 [Polyangiaceae bacterium]|nr:hypothetical protein [Polyangiaceae bacterium]
MAYSTLDDVFLLGLSAQAFVVLARPFDAVDGASATIRLRAHGLTALDVITFEGTEGGALPTGISAFTPYYPIPITADLFRVALTPNGTPIASWAVAGSGSSVQVDTTRRILAHNEECAAEIDEHLTGHKPPIQADPTGKYPQVLVGLNARMTARAAVISLAIENDAYRVPRDRLMDREEADRKMLADWEAGKPIQPRPTDGTPGIAENSARTAAGVPIDWRNCGVL